MARIAQAWIAQPGFPLVTVAPAPGGRGLRVRQERFFADPRVPAARRRGRWPVPLVVKWADGGGPSTGRFLVDKPSQALTLPATDRPAWYYANVDAGGFYRTRHDDDTVTALVGQLDRALTAVERHAFASDQWALVRSARSPIERFLDVADALGDETDHDVLDGLSGPLGLVEEQVVPPGGDMQADFRAWIAGRFLPQLGRLGWDASPGEHELTRLRRAALVRLVGGVAEEPGVLAEARRRVDAYLADRRALEPNLTDAVVSLAARVGDEALYERYRAAVAAAETPQERRRFLLNLPSFRTKETLKRTLAAVLTPDIPTQDVAFVLIRLLGNPFARIDAWRFIQKRWSAIRRRVPPLMLSRLVDATPALREPRHAREVQSFFRKHPLPEAERALKQALEVFRLNDELRRREAKGVGRWLSGK